MELTKALPSNATHASGMLTKDALAQYVKSGTCGKILKGIISELTDQRPKDPQRHVIEWLLQNDACDMRGPTCDFDYCYDCGFEY